MAGSGGAGGAGGNGGAGGGCSAAACTAQCPACTASTCDAGGACTPCAAAFENDVCDTGQIGSRCVAGKCTVRPSCNKDQKGVSPAGSGPAYCHNYGISPKSCCEEADIASPEPFHVACAASGAGGAGGGSSCPHPATLAPFRIDKFEVTIGRFRAFLCDYDAWHGTAKHPLAGEGGDASINDVSGQKLKAGWRSEFDGFTLRDQGGTAISTGLPASAQAFLARLTGGEAQTATLPSQGGYTSPWEGLKVSDLCSPAADPTWPALGVSGDTLHVLDTLPMTGLSWYESYAFCIWDGGRLPTFAEWDYVASNGAEQRKYPWGFDEPKQPDSGYAAISLLTPGYQFPGSPTIFYFYPVGTFADDNPAPPIGMGRDVSGKGVFDLAGNAAERVLDARQSGASTADYLPTSPATCDNCARLDFPATVGVDGTATWVLGSTFNAEGTVAVDVAAVDAPQKGKLYSVNPAEQSTPGVGFRCARRSLPKLAVRHALRDGTARHAGRIRCDDEQARFARRGGDHGRDPAASRLAHARRLPPGRRCAAASPTVGRRARRHRWSLLDRRAAGRRRHGVGVAVRRSPRRPRGGAQANARRRARRRRAERAVHARSAGAGAARAPVDRARLRRRNDPGR
jgi:hypothetical protein